VSEKWRIVPLSEICDINPRLGKIGLADEDLFAFVPMAAVGAADGSINVTAKRPFAAVKKGFTLFQSGDVLFAKITPCMENGKMAVVPKLENLYGFGSTEFHVIRPKDDVDPKYVYYYVSAQGFRQEAAHHMTGAVGQKRVPTDFLKQSTIPLPPTFEDQKRIVAEIEKQFSRLDEAVSSLRRIQANLKRYKAAVLKAAVEGKLTEQWRKDHPDAEPADQLLKRILAERRAKWEAEELAKMKAKGIKPKDESWKKKFKEPAGPDTANLPELPEVWVWATAIQACDPVVDCHNKTAPYAGSGIPLVRTSNIRDGKLSLAEVRFVDQPTYDFWSRRCPPKAGDVLFTREAPMGEAAIIPNGITLCMGQRMMLMRPSIATTSTFLLAALMSPVVKRIIDLTAVGSGVKHLRVGDVELLPLPLPPIPEQNAIVAELDRRLSVTEELESTIETNLKRAERLRQTILQQAFSDGLP